MNGSSSGVRERVDVADDLEYRIAGRGGIVVVTLRPGAGLVAEPGGLLYRRGGVGWSLAPTGRNVLGRFLNRAMRRAAGGSSCYVPQDRIALRWRSFCSALNRLRKLL